MNPRFGHSAFPVLGNGRAAPAFERPSFPEAPADLARRALAEARRAHLLLGDLRALRGRLSADTAAWADFTAGATALLAALERRVADLGAAARDVR